MIVETFIVTLVLFDQALFFKLCEAIGRKSRGRLLWSEDCEDVAFQTPRLHFGTFESCKKVSVMSKEKPSHIYCEIFIRASGS